MGEVIIEKNFTQSIRQTVKKDLQSKLKKRKNYLLSL